jgi:large subunit ribosomal protein L5
MAKPKQEKGRAPRMREKYRNEIVAKLKSEFQYTNPMQVPTLKSIVLNLTTGDAIVNPKVLDNSLAELAAITGQKPQLTRAKKSIATFKLREGMPIGVKVTLRKDRMWEFFDRLVSVALPRVRDFRGLSQKGFDGSGNYNMGITEQIIFPEIEYDKIDKIRGMNISIVTSAKTDKEGMALLDALGFPFFKRT